MILVLLIVISLSLLFIKYIQIYNNVRRMKKIAGNIPGPKPLPLVGNALSLGTSPYSAFTYIERIVEQYGPTTAIWLGSEPHIIISSKEDVKAILTDNFQLTKSSLYDFSKDWVGKGLLTADGERWRRNRKILTPTFHFKMLENYIEIFNSNYKILTDLLEAEVGNSGFNIEMYLDNCVTDTLYENALRIKSDVQFKKNSKFAESQMNVIIGCINRNFKFWLHPKILFDLSSSGMGFNKGIAYLHNFFTQVISDKRRILRESIHGGEIKEKYDNGKNKLSFIDLLLKISMDPNMTLTDEDICYEVSTFYAAGHGTLTATMGFAIYKLAENPDVQDKVVQEIEAYFGDDKRQPTYQDLQQFPYLEMVIKETLRHYPVTFLGRKLNMDFPLPSGYTVPAGGCIMFDWIRLHKDPEEFSDPESFNPDHFLPEACAQRHPFAYVPFSAGPRNCIGQKYAMLDMKAGLIQLLRSYKFFIAENLPKIKLSYAIVLYSLTGINVRIEKRYP